MKLLKLTVIGLFVAAASSLVAQEVNLNELVREVGAEPQNVEVIAQRAVSQSPDQIADIVDVLVQAYPELAERIVFGAIAGLPRPDRDKIHRLLRRAIFRNPGLAASIVAGALRATEGLESYIEQVATAALNEFFNDPTTAGIGSGINQSGVPAWSFDGSVLSPSRPPASSSPSSK